MKDLYVIIVHFGDISVTKKCIDGVFSYTSVQNIILVNNDPKPTFSEKVFKDGRIEFIDHRKNVGFAAGVNIGIKRAIIKGAKYVLLLNNDTKITSDFIAPLYTFLEGNRDAGIAAPVIEFKKNGQNLYDLGGSVQGLIGRTEHNNQKVILNKKPIETTYVSGCCMLIKSEIINKVGFFDEAYFLYYEDVDYCLRTRKLGYKIFVVPESKIFHYLSESIGKNSGLAVYYQTKSALIFGKKNLKFRFMNILFVFIQSFLFLSKKPSLGWEAFSAFFSEVI